MKKNNVEIVYKNPSVIEKQTKKKTEIENLPTNLKTLHECTLIFIFNLQITRVKIGLHNFL